MQNNTDSYPIILIPRQLLRIQDELPTLPPEPIEPKLQLPPEPFNPQSTSSSISQKSGSGFWNIMGSIIGAIAFNAFIIYVATETEAYWVFLIYALAIISIPFIISSSKKEKADARKKAEIAFRKYLSEKEQYPFKVKEAQIKYAAALDDYNRSLKEYNSVVDNLKSDKVVSNHRIELLNAFCRSITKPERVSENYTKGASEVFFMQYLSAYFGDNIHDDFSIINEHHNDEPQMIYKPDYVFCYENSIVIDIEIDEPYVIDTGEPIHFKGADSLRNQFFLDNNWVIIRFTENQVIKYPDECCFLVANIIKEVTGNEFFLNSFKKGITLPPDNSIWTKEAAHKLAYRRVRDTLLADLKFEKAKYYRKHTKRSNQHEDDNRNLADVKRGAGSNSLVRFVDGLFVLIDDENYELRDISFNEIISFLGNDYEVIEHNDYSLELAYRSIGLSFYCYFGDAYKRLICLKIQEPFSGRIFTGTEIGKTKLVEVVETLYGNDKIHDIPFNFGEGKFSWIDYQGIKFFVENGSYLSYFPSLQEILYRKEIVQISIGRFIPL